MQFRHKVFQFSSTNPNMQSITTSPQTTYKSLQQTTSSDSGDNTQIHRNNESNKSNKSKQKKKSDESPKTMQTTMVASTTISTLQQQQQQQQQNTIPEISTTNVITNTETTNVKTTLAETTFINTAVSETSLSEEALPETSLPQTSFVETTFTAVHSSSSSWWKVLNTNISLKWTLIIIGACSFCMILCCIIGMKRCYGAHKRRHYSSVNNKKTADAEYTDTENDISRQYDNQDEQLELTRNTKASSQHFEVNIK